MYADLDRARGRHVTWRVVTFVLALLVIAGVAFGAVSWAAKRTYFVGFAGTDVVIYQGRPGGLLGIDPELEKRLELERSELTEAQVEDVASNPSFGSLADAKSYANSLVIDAHDRAAASTTTTSSTSTTTTERTSTTTRPVTSTTG